MADKLYDKGREGFAGGDIGWDDDTIKAVLLDEADYTIDLANDEFLSDIPAAARVATSGAMTSKTITAGVVDCADFTFSAVTGDESESVTFYQDTGNAATSRLICNVNSPADLPITPNGGDIEFRVDSGANKLFKL